MTTPLHLLTTWVNRSAKSGRDWFESQCQSLTITTDQKKLFAAIGLAPRKLGKFDIVLSARDLSDADDSIVGWEPHEYSIDMAARLAFVLAAYRNTDAFRDTFDTIWRTADVGEQVALYRGLCLYPDPEHVRWRAEDGCRTNIKGVFEAIAHRNPFPAAHFDEIAFNQMCLKALFVGSAIHLIRGVDARSNPALARMMTDYAFERWAASRTVSPELWRCVATHPDERCLDALGRALDHSDECTRLGAGLACSTSPHPAARRLLSERPKLFEHIQVEGLDWADLANRFASAS